MLKSSKKFKYYYTGYTNVNHFLLLCTLVLDMKEYWSMGFIHRDLHQSFVHTSTNFLFQGL